MYPLLTNINSQFIDDCGKPLAGGKVYTYEAKTTTPKPTYADVEGSAVNTNPIILDESGRANIHLDVGAYRIRVLNKKGALIADTPEISRYVTGTELDKFLQNVENGVNELNQVKETLETVAETVVSNQKGVAGGLAPLNDESALVDPIYLPKATETTVGVAEIATHAEINTATNDASIVTPLKFLVGLKNHLNASGDAPMFPCRAWVNFNGSDGVAIRGSGNVSSITDNGVGHYTANFTIPMPDANFAVSGFCNFPSASVAGVISFGSDFTMSANSLNIKAGNTTTGGTQDSTFITIGVHR